MSDPAWSPFIAAVSATDAVQPSFAQLAAIVRDRIGTVLFTASAFDVPAGRMVRIFSENHAVYPVGGLKSIPPGIWSETVIERQELLIRLTIEDISEVFFDWRVIQSLGCGSIANIPVVVSGKTIGALNLLHETGYYSPERLVAIREILPFATIALLLAERDPALWSAPHA